VEPPVFGLRSIPVLHALSELERSRSTDFLAPLQRALEWSMSWSAPERTFFIFWEFWWANCWLFIIGFKNEGMQLFFWVFLGTWIRSIQIATWFWRWSNVNNAFEDGCKTKVEDNLLSLSYNRLQMHSLFTLLRLRLAYPQFRSLVFLRFLSFAMPIYLFLNFFLFFFLLSVSFNKWWSDQFVFWWFLVWCVE